LTLSCGFTAAVNSTCVVIIADNRDMSYLSIFLAFINST
jgi:hypothetical protein